MMGMWCGDKNMVSGCIVVQVKMRNCGVDVSSVGLTSRIGMWDSDVVR